MTWLKELALSVSCLCIVIALIDIILPQNTFRNSMKLLTGAVLLITLISPFFGEVKIQTPNHTYRQLDSDEIAQNILNRSAKGAADAMGDEIQNIMENHQITGQIKIIVDIGEDGSIDMKQAVIKLNDGKIADTQALCDEIKTKTGIEVVIEE